MGFKTAFLSAILTPCLAFCSTQAEAARARMIRDLDFIHNTFSVMYAPAEWKERYADWNLAREIELAKERVQTMDDVSLKGFQRVVRQFVQSTKDYHVGVQFWSTEFATLPFRVCGSQGKYFITAIDRARLSSRSFSFQEGDELVLFDGRPTDEVVQELKKVEVGDSSPNTDQAVAEIYLTSRAGASGLIVPRGPVQISVRSATTGVVSSYQICWDYFRERIKEPSLAKLDEEEAYSEPKKVGEHRFLHKKMTTPLINTVLKNSFASAGDPNGLGARESFVPDLGTKIWSGPEDSPFEAYIFKSPSGRKVGYIRIPIYDGGAVEVEEFGHLIAHLEANTDALVLDQVNNPGGSVFYLYGLASHLTQTPLHTPKHRMAITQEEVYWALFYEQYFELVQSDDDARALIGDTIEGSPVSYQTAQFILNYYRFIIDEWNDGRMLTQPYYLFGVDWINPNPGARYTKPILLLANRLCFSGGDFLPAIMQDNERVTVFGTRTAGAGGYVETFSYHNPFGVASISYTASLAERIDSNPIENLGVTPDICYELTQEDFQTGYAPYKQAVLEALEGILD